LSTLREETKSKETEAITEKLADCIAAVRFETLPPEAISMAKVVTLDGIANMLAGSQEPLGKILTRYVSSMGGIPAATVIGTATKTSPPMAAFANAAFCHSMDYEAMWWPPTHPTSPVLPSILALAEHEGISGKRLVEALVVGFEVQGRLNLSVEWIQEPYSYFHPPGSLGMIGSAAACAKLLGLDAWTTRMAMGIAASRASGLWANTGSMTKSQHSANSARSGVEAVILAREGYTSNENIIENPKGGFAQLVLRGNADLPVIVKDFGNPYRMVNPGLTIKKYPAQTTTHWGIDAALELKSRGSFSPNEIRNVTVTVGHPNWSAHWPRPRSGLEGKFSIHYTVAIALLDGEFSIDSFTDERRFSPDVETMLEKITVLEDEKIPPGLNFAETWAIVEITLRDGRVLKARCDRPKGRWDAPLSREERLAKFHDCAKRVLKKPRRDRISEIVEGLESLENGADLMALLSTGKGSEA
jgi:aconitate decarboxylase